ncbi:nucleoside phosphorylase [Pseudenhygromyxa sp. WMMC2535]|uniref:nucleoside phosphorylase n=1 Tax=Pseudenhygromyxa sp. WMMC2535 TaxID=2712867 RepID=UPI0015522567|nr:nucleoside phosphorylase [Pseudenhygromyxa sp. WMMC2535]NVB40190.1 nucleoside phosphorylase [Pseudenhygromyxa sp. WMMC2535]
MSERSANDPHGADDRQYHIGLRPGEVAPAILLVGDPKRAKRVAEGYFESYGEPISEREFVTYTGRYRGLPMTVMGTGMGAANTEIAVIELCSLFEDPRGLTIIRAGSCGALQPGIGLGELVITQGSYRLEETSLSFVGPGFPALAHPEAIMSLLWAAEDAGATHHLGVTATASGFYGAQGREVPGFPPRNPHIESELSRQGVSNLEMESSTLLTLSTLRGFRAGAVCAVYANRVDNTFIDDADKAGAEGRCVEVALNALVHLQTLTAARGDRPCWHPGLAR